MTSPKFNRICISVEKTNSFQKRIQELTQTIIDSWDKKVVTEIDKYRLEASKTMPQFRVHLTTKRQSQSQIQSSSDSQRKKAHLVIIVQESSLSPGHLLALSGQLSTFGQGPKQFIPSHVAELAIANCIAITVLQNYLSFIHESKSQRNRQFRKVHSLSYVDCLNYYGAFNVSAKYNSLMPKQRGSNILDGGAPFYAIYPTKKGLLAVGNLEPKFYNEMIEGSQMSSADKSFCLENQLNFEAWPKLRKILGQQLMSRTAEEWEQIMNTRDTCVTAIKDLSQIPQLLHPTLLRPPKL